MKFRSPYEKLYFRVLGLNASASLEEIDARVEELLKLSQVAYIELPSTLPSPASDAKPATGQALAKSIITDDSEKMGADGADNGEPSIRVPAELNSTPEGRRAMNQLMQYFALDLPWLEPVQAVPSLIKEAQNELHNLEQRLWHKVFWFHVFSDLDQKALEFLVTGESEKALIMWKEQANNASAQPKVRASAVHSLALAYHTRALAVPLGTSRASAELMEAGRWWGRALEKSCLAFILSDGENFSSSDLSIGNNVEEVRMNAEDAHTEAGRTRMFWQKLRRYLPQLLNYERYELEKNSSATPSISFANDDLELPEEYIVRDFQLSRAQMDVAVEKARCYASHYQFDKADETIQSVIKLASSDEYRELLAVKDSLACRRVLRGLEPVEKPVGMSDINGFGLSLSRLRNYDEDTRSFAAYLTWTIAHIPVWWFKRYRVRQHEEDDQWEFMGVYTGSDDKSKLYNTVAVVIYALLVAAGFWTGV